MSGSLSSTKVSSTFQQSVRPRKPDRRKRVPPVSIRFSDEERRLLASHAGNKPLSTYVREYVTQAHSGKVRKRSRSSAHDPKLTAQLLSTLGRSELAGLLRDTLRAVDNGALILNGETEAQLRQASAELMVMRQMLIEAFGLRCGVSP